MKAIPGTNSNYFIDINGRVFSAKRNKYLNHQNFSNGYKSVSIKKDGKSKHYTIHRLLAETFIPNPENKPTVNHVNGIKDDNRIENLQWATYSENNKHAFDLKLNKPILGSNRHTSTIDEEMVYLIREKFKSQKISQISKDLNLGYHLVRCVCLRKTWKHI